MSDQYSRIRDDSGPDMPGGQDSAYGFVDFAVNRTNLKFDMHTWGGEEGKIIIKETVTLTSHKHEKPLRAASGRIHI